MAQLGPRRNSASAPTLSVLKSQQGQRAAEFHRMIAGWQPFIEGIFFHFGTLNFRFFLAHGALMFHGISIPKTFLVTWKCCTRDVPTGLIDFPFQSITGGRFQAVSWTLDISNSKINKSSWHFQFNGSPRTRSAVEQETNFHLSFTGNR